ncbi:hypothetical protein SOVF_121330 [Spinacia oleracea]|nr:hypothetical protein SOVF_121330 [Spinacia oleracea]
MEKKMQETEQSAQKLPINHLSKLLQLPSFVRRGAKMVKAKMVKLGRRTLSLAVPLRMALRIYMQCRSSMPSSDSSAASRAVLIDSSIFLGGGNDTGRTVSLKKRYRKNCDLVSETNYTFPLFAQQVRIFLVTYCITP